MRTINQEIARLHRLEERARKLSLKLHQIKADWHTQRAFIVADSSDTWIKHCEAEDYNVDYTFDDTLC